MIKKKRKRNQIYALYKGDKFIDLGTKEYLANLLGVKRYTIYFYSTPTYKKRVMDYSNRYIVIEVGDDEEDVN